MLKDQKGVSLVEIMVALSIFGIGMTMAMRTLPMGSRKTTESRNITIAMNLAQEKLEDLKGLGYNSADLTDGNHDDADNPIRRNFRRSWVIVDDSPITDMKTITVNVTYPTSSSDGVQTLRTFVSSRQ